MMTQQEYMDWWIALPEDYAELDEPARTLILHVEALQDRIAEQANPPDTFCACAWDHPADVCMVHAAKESETP